MTKKDSPGTGGLVVLTLLAAGVFFCGVDAMLSDSVTTPSKFGGNHRVHGTDTILVGVGWILLGLGFTAKIILSRQYASVRTVAAVGLAASGGLFWLVAV